ncbi:MAG: hypothetical protein WBB42_12005 [Polyangiales bacterium]
MLARIHWQAVGAVAFDDVDWAAEEEVFGGGSYLQHPLLITLLPLPPRTLAFPAPLITILVNNHMQPRARARHADVGDAAVPVGFDVGDAGYDDDVVFQALEAGDGGPGDVFERGAAEVGDGVVA